MSTADRPTTIAPIAREAKRDVEQGQKSAAGSAFIEENCVSVEQRRRQAERRRERCAQGLGGAAQGDGPLPPLPARGTAATRRGAKSTKRRFPTAHTRSRYGVPGRTASRRNRSEGHERRGMHCTHTIRDLVEKYLDKKLTLARTSSNSSSSSSSSRSCQCHGPTRVLHSRSPRPDRVALHSTTNAPATQQRALGYVIVWAAHAHHRRKTKKKRRGGKNDVTQHESAVSHGRTASHLPRH